ncbi:MAG TPA: helix-turn-helix domain-containing protein [Candidatus Angelobacter sp.]|nr:helix-turn-helix domain-containing protein [Candidatus Angelobacter sp.]
MSNIEIVKVYDIKECAQALNLTADYVRKLAKLGKLGHRKVGRRFKFSATDINRYLNGEKAVIQVCQRQEVKQ